MVKLGSALVTLMILTSCSQVFDTSLYQKVDSAPTLSASSLSSASVTAIHDMLKDPNFYTELAGSTSLAVAVLTNLIEVELSPSSTTSNKALAERTLILINTYGSSAATVVNNDLTTFLPLLASGNLATSFSTTTGIQTAAASLFAGLNATQIQTALMAFSFNDTQFSALYTLTAPTPTNTAAFFGTDNNADLAQIGVLTALSVMLMDLCNNNPTTTADFIVTGNAADVSPAALLPGSTFNVALTNFTNAFSGTPPASYTFYLQVLASALKF